MNYGGSGTSKDDPIVIDTLEDLAPLMQRSAGGTLHIAFQRHILVPRLSIFVPLDGILTEG
jgi:hypothetical protein